MKLYDVTVSSIVKHVYSTTVLAEDEAEAKIEAQYEAEDVIEPSMFEDEVEVLTYSSVVTAAADVNPEDWPIEDSFDNDYWGV